MNDELKIILRKMCESVGADFDTIDFNKKDWFWDHEWTAEQEEEFRKWLLQHLKKLPMKRFRQLYSSGKYQLEKKVMWFCMMYAWKIKQQ